MGFALVYLGEHYLSDVVVGALFALIGWRVADAAFALPIWRRRGPPADERGCGLGGARGARRLTASRL